MGQHYRFAITGETNQKLVLLPRSYNCLPVLFHRHYCFQSYCEITSRSRVNLTFRIISYIVCNLIRRNNDNFPLALAVERAIVIYLRQRDTLPDFPPPSSKSNSTSYIRFVWTKRSRNYSCTGKFNREKGPCSWIVSDRGGPREVKRADSTYNVFSLTLRQLLARIYS